MRTTEEDRAPDGARWQSFVHPHHFDAKPLGPTPPQRVQSEEPVPELAESWFGRGQERPKRGLRPAPSIRSAEVAGVGASHPAVDRSTDAQDELLGDPLADTWFK